MYKGKRVAAILMAAGKSTRMGFDKLSYKMDGVPVWLVAFTKLAGHPFVDDIVVVAGDNGDAIRRELEAGITQKRVAVADGGETRAESVLSGLAACADADIVAIHDAARPYVTADVISRAVEAAAEDGAAAPAVPLKDTVKQAGRVSLPEDADDEPPKGGRGLIVRTLPRETLMAAQTPQVFARAAFAEAFALIQKEDYPLITDDCLVMELAGKPVRLVDGDFANIKITTQDDLPKPRQHALLPRVGHGYDVHRLVPGRRLVLGGVEIPYPSGLLGHSDADVLLHAITDALLGAAGLGDIGGLFPDTDDAYKDANSLELLAEAFRAVQNAGFAVQNADATVICQSPRLSVHIPAMRRNIARTLLLREADVNVKATTEEGLGFTGAREGIAAHCVVLLAKEI